MASNGKMAKITIPVSVNLGTWTVCLAEVFRKQRRYLQFFFWRNAHLLEKAPTKFHSFDISFSFGIATFSYLLDLKCSQVESFCIPSPSAGLSILYWGGWFVQLQEQNESQSAFEKQCKSVFVPSPRCLSLIWMPLRLRSSTYWLLRHVFSS